MRDDEEKATSDRRWLAAYVKMHHEKKVRDRLREMNIECFLPVQEEIRLWSDRKKKVERVLIPMMIFVYVNSDEQRSVITLPSVIRYMVLRGEHTPTVIPVAQMVRVIKGSLAGLEGELIIADGKSGVAIRINQLGCAMVEMQSSMVERIV